MLSNEFGFSSKTRTDPKLEMWSLALKEFAKTMLELIKSNVIKIKKIPLPKPLFI